MSHFRASNHGQVGDAIFRASVRANGPIEGVMHSILSESHHSPATPDADNRYLSREAFQEASARQVLLNDDSSEDGGNMSTVSSASTSSSSTILARRPSASLQQPTTVSVASQQQSPNQQTSNNDERRCWICFGEDNDSDGHWVKPCRCSLVSHEQCLLDWISENQKKAPKKKVQCPQCAIVYKLTEHRSLSLSLMTFVDSLVRTVAPYLTFAGIGGSLLISSTAYGVFAIMSFFGHRQGERLIGYPSSWTWLTWACLPMVPAGLVMTRSRLRECVFPFATASLLVATRNKRQTLWPPSPAVAFGLLTGVRLLYLRMYTFAELCVSRHLIRKQRTRYRFSVSQQTSNRQRNGSVAGAQQNAAEQGGERVEQDVNITDSEAVNVLYIRGRRDISFIVLGVLLLPTISSIMGSCLYQFRAIRHYFPEPFQRNILGGCLFVAAKDIANLYYRYERVWQKQTRRINSYTGDNGNA